MSSTWCSEVNAYGIDTGTGSSLATVLLPLLADHRQCRHFMLFSRSPAVAYFPKKIHVTTKPSPWRKIFSFLVAFSDCVQPGLLKDVADFIWSTDDGTLKFLSWHQVRQKPIKNFFGQSVYLGKNVTPLGFFHLYQTGIDVVIIFLMEFNPAMVNWKASQNSDVSPGWSKCPHR